jgi:hypothetical protein
MPEVEKVLQWASNASCDAELLNAAIIEYEGATGREMFFDFSDQQWCWQDRAA